MIRLLAGVLVLALVAYPLVLQPAKWVVIAAGAALILCATGMIGRFAPVFTIGIGVALCEYALALSLADDRPRLGIAVVLGVVTALALEVTDFDRRFRHVAIARGVVLAQLRYWAAFALSGATAAVVLIVVAGGLTSAIRLPWVSVIAMVSAAVSLGAAAFALRRAER